MRNTKAADGNLHKDENVRLVERELARIEQLRNRNWDLMEKKGITETRTKKMLEAER